MKHYLFDKFGRFCGTSDNEVPRSTPVSPPVESEDYNWNGIEWVYVPHVQIENIPPSVPVLQAASMTVSPVEFKLLFTSQERVAIKAARESDPVIDDFYDIVEDPRLTHVDLGLKSTKDALAYMVVVGLIAAERQGEILAGKMQ